MGVEFPCSNCRKAEDPHSPGCLTLLAEILDTWPITHDWLKEETDE